MAYVGVEVFGDDQPTGEEHDINHKHKRFTNFSFVKLLHRASWRRLSVGVASAVVSSKKTALMLDSQVEINEPLKRMQIDQDSQSGWRSSH